MLTNERIRVLASKKGVKETAVKNFLSTVDANDTISSALLNLNADAASYKWNAATVNAIRQGIVEHFNGTK
jgi:hypothetical protein